eukprot:76731-Prymnesium_polylepis.1
MARRGCGCDVLGAAPTTQRGCDAHHRIPRDRTTKATRARDGRRARVGRVGKSLCARQRKEVGAVCTRR